MKKTLSTLLIFTIMGLNTCVFANSVNNETNNAAENEINKDAIKHDDAPVWAEYVAPKYRNPRSDFSRKAAVSELVTGVILTDLIITSPIGIPMMIHGTTKVKMVSYNNRKNIFDEEIEKAQYIEDDNERKAEYKAILNRCHLKESTRQHYARKEAKAKAKAEKKAKNNQKNNN